MKFKPKFIPPDKSQRPILEQFREYLDALQAERPEKPRLVDSDLAAVSRAYLAAIIYGHLSSS